MGGKSYGRACLTVGHVLCKDMSYRWACVAGEDKEMFYGKTSNERTCFIEGHILWEDMSYGSSMTYGRKYLTGGHVL